LVRIEDGQAHRYRDRKVRRRRASSDVKQEIVGEARRCRVSGIRSDDREFIAAPASAGVGLAQRVLDGACGGAKHLISGFVAPLVVDRLRPSTSDQ
jgi:hypothetical protein